MSHQIRSILTRITLTAAAILLVPCAAMACDGQGMSAEDTGAETRSNVSLRVEKDGVVVQEFHSEDGLVDDNLAKVLGLEGSLLQLVQRMVAETMAQNLLAQDRIRQRSGLNSLGIEPSEESSMETPWELRRDEQPEKRTFIYKRSNNDFDEPVLIQPPREPELRFVGRSTASGISRPVMNRGRMARILAFLDDEPFSEDQLEILLGIADRFRLTTAQASKLVDQLAFSEDRLEALTALYPSIVDPQNFSEVYELLDFAVDRKKLRKRVQTL